MPCQDNEALLHSLAQRFRRFAQRECHVSPLYKRLALGTAGDPDILAIAAEARQGQPVPNLARLSALLAAHAAVRDLYRVSIEWLGEVHPRLELTAFEGGAPTTQRLAHCGSHGQWLAWL